MPRGTLFVMGADPQWFAALEGAMPSGEYRLVRSAGGSEIGADTRRGRADIVLLEGSRAGGPERDSGSEEPGGRRWRLLSRPAGEGSAEEEKGIVVGSADLPPGEPAGRLRELLHRAETRSGAQEDPGAGAVPARLEKEAPLRKETERLQELNANLIEALPEGVLAFDDRGLVTHWSRGAVEILDWEPEEVAGRPVTRFLRASAGDAALLKDLLSRGEGTREIEITLLSKSQQPRLVQLRLSPLGGGMGAHHGALVLLTDLAKQRRVEEQIRRRDRLASVGELSAGVAHEIRNPLAGIGTTAELLRSRIPAGTPEVEFVDVILEEVGRLDKIIADLLSFARPRKPQPLVTDIHRVLDRMLLLLRRQIGRRNIEVIRRYGRKLPRLEIDPDQTLQLFLNVGLNAVEAMEEGGTLTVSTEGVPPSESGEAEPERTNWLRIMVQDSGPGVPPDVRDKVFNPFFTTKGKGSGLGLAICQRIVEEQGGSIYLDSSPSQPTTVTVDFPLSQTGPAPGEQTELFAGDRGKPGPHATGGNS